MGNYISCASSTVPSNTVKVILMNGTVQEFQRRIKAAELMLENAQQFVCHSSALHIGRRITPLSADEDLEMGHLYFLLPMHKLHSVLSGSDMASLAFKANSAIKQNSKNSAQILPVFGDLRPLPLPLPPPPQGKDDQESCCELDEEKSAAVPRLNLEELPDLQMALAKHRANLWRSWKPKLETINESRPKLRELMQIST